MYYFWMFLGFSIFVGVYWYFYLKGQEDYYNHIEKKSQRRYICKRFHNAYLAYWGKPDLANSVFKKYSKTILSDDCLQWTDREWKILDDAQVEEWIKESYQLVASKLPKAIRQKYIL